MRRADHEAMSDRSDADTLAGRLLIAMPGISDPRFEHALMLVCLHTPQNAMGVRLNAPMEDLTVAEVLKKLSVEGRARDPRQVVLNGGPVERERGYVLHSDDYEVAGSTMRVSEGLSLTATREVLEALTDQYLVPRRSLLALGYAGWGPGQLETELRENVWLSSAADLDLVFDDDYDTKWERALAKMGVSPAMLSTQAGRA
jgi:putative transcriptional regulator